MNSSLPFFNWSLKKLLATEQGSFNHARIKILYTILLFSFLKVCVVLTIALYHDQQFHIVRGLIALVAYSVMFKLLLASKSNVRGIIHVMIWAGILIIWTNIFLSAHTINIITLQFVFMAMISSFYFLNRPLALVYSIASALPLVIFMLNAGTADILPFAPGELAPPGNLIMVLLNFVTLIIALYLYHQAFSTNIAEQESLNRQLKLTAEDARKFAQSRSDFLSTMSHELRTPLNSVIGMTDLLLDDPHNEDQKESLKILHFSARSLYTLINDILDFNKLDSGKLDLEMISVNLPQLMRSIASGLELQATEKGLKLLLDVDSSLTDQHVITDQSRLAQVIYNLLGNGIKFTNRGSVTLSLKVLTRFEDKIKIRFSVKDTGIGIRKDKQESVFEPFIQASANTTRNFGGTGLGLSIVKRLLFLFSSTIHLESSPGKGSHFFFDITFKTSASGANAALEQEQQYDLSGLRILVAEDNPMNIYLVKKLCLKWNVQPVIAVNGVEVINKLTAEDFDVILMDIHMPEMDGYQATQHIRGMKNPVKATIPIIALTASVSESMNMKVWEAGMNDYVRKPFDPRELYSKLKGIAAE